MKRTGHITGSVVVAAALFATASAIAQTPSWTVPPDSARCPSKWGAGDERGAGNLMGPKSVLNAAKLIKTGEVIELSHVLHTGMPISSTRRYSLSPKSAKSGRSSMASPIRPTKTRSTTASKWTISRPAPDSRS